MSAYEVELLDAHGNPPRTAPDPDPDYPADGPFQVELARAIAVHRPQMSMSTARVHMDWIIKQLWFAKRGLFSVRYMG